MHTLLKDIADKIMVFDALTLANTNRQPTLVIDDFIHSQSVSDNGVDDSATSQTEYAIAGTHLTDVTRKVSALATGGIYAFQTVIIDGSYLKINNSGSVNCSSYIEYFFQPSNFMTQGAGFLLTATEVDFDISLNISVNNGLVSSGFKNHNGTSFYLPYDEFLGDLKQFSQVTNMRIDFKIANPTQHHHIRAKIARMDNYNKVPNQGILNLLGLGLLDLEAFNHKNQS